jgi:hypothetical protein
MDLGTVYGSAPRWDPFQALLSLIFNRWELDAAVSYGGGGGGGGQGGSGGRFGGLTCCAFR